MRRLAEAVRALAGARRRRRWCWAARKFRSAMQAGSRTGLGVALVDTIDALALAAIRWARGEAATGGLSAMAQPAPGVPS